MAADALACKKGEICVPGNNADCTAKEKEEIELYRSEPEPFEYSWDPYFEHPEIVYQETESGKKPLRYWSAEDTENYMKEKFSIRDYIIYNKELYFKYIDACVKYGENNISAEAVFDVDFNTPVYRNGDYYRQDFKGSRYIVLFAKV